MVSALPWLVTATAIAWFSCVMPMTMGVSALPYLTAFVTRFSITCARQSGSALARGVSPSTFTSQRPVGGLQGHALHARTDDRRHVHGLPDELEPAGIEARKVHEVGHHSNRAAPPKTGCLSMYFRSDGIADRPRQDLRGERDGLERLPEIVGDHRAPFGPQVLELLRRTDVLERDDRALNRPVEAEDRRARGQDRNRLARCASNEQLDPLGLLAAEGSNAGQEVGGQRLAVRTGEDLLMALDRPERAADHLERAAVGVHARAARAVHQDHPHGALIEHGPQPAQRLFTFPLCPQAVGDVERDAEQVHGCAHPVDDGDLHGV